MTQPTGIDSVADTARWVAIYRAEESERLDAHFRDPYARRLAGTRGEQIHAALPKEMRNASWSVVARTLQIDRWIQREVAAGTRLILNLAAGLDTRPYRLALPEDLTWIEVDSPALLAEKEKVLADAVPICHLERIPADLANDDVRRKLLADIGSRTSRTLVVTEGLIMYLTENQVTGLAHDLARSPAYQGWITDLISPGLLRLIDKSWGKVLRDGNAAMHFAPSNGPDFFLPLGWKAEECRAAFPEARRLKRLPFPMSLFALLPGLERFNADQPWSGSCFLRRTTS